MVIVAPVTTRIRGIPGEVPLGPEDGLPRACVADLDAIYTISKSQVDTHQRFRNPENASGGLRNSLRFRVGRVMAAHPLYG